LLAAAFRQPMRECARFSAAFVEFANGRVCASTKPRLQKMNASLDQMALDLLIVTQNNRNKENNK
jgi:hypothetical protein